MKAMTEKYFPITVINFPPQIYMNDKDDPFWLQYLTKGYRLHRCNLRKQLNQFVLKKSMWI